MFDRKRVVIIGSGLGGLSCGTILQKNGFDVTVVNGYNRVPDPPASTIPFIMAFLGVNV